MEQTLTAFWKPDWLPLALGLTAVGLLPVKKREGRLVVSVILALLWGWLAAVAAWASPDSGSFWASSWTFLASLQTVVFLVTGVLTDQLRFEARNGFWTVIGTLEILYSLVAFPLLSPFESFQESAFGAPFPLVLFTCGVLLFTVDTADRIVSWAFVVPLLWALVGGPDGTLRPEIWSLHVALLTGTWFALLPPDLRGGGPRRASPGEEYGFAYRSRACFGYGLWSLLLMTLLLITVSGAKVLGTNRLDRLTTNLALLSALGIALWLAFPAWQSLWFRYISWGAARVGGRIWGWLQGVWKWAFLLLAAIAAVALLDMKELNQAVSSRYPTFAKAIIFLDDPGVEDLAILVLSGTVLLWLVYLAYQGRKRLAIGAFANHTGNSDWKEWVEGLGPRLQNELARIADLYKVIDEARPSSKSAVIEVTASVQDVGDILKQTSSSSIDFKIFQIPTDFIFQLASRLVSGPRLTGALHKGDKDLFLTAEISGGGRLAGNWHVDRSKLTEEERRLPEKEVIYKLVEYLSFRVATHLVDIGSPRWQAVRCFTDGLRFYRETQRSKKDISRNLREAERCFIRALSDDQKFAQCHYNLGVVYRQLEEYGSAESAFRRALEQDPENYESYYALAETFAQTSSYAKAVWFCEAAIRVDPTDARAWDLRAYADRRHLQELDSLEKLRKLGQLDELDRLDKLLKLAQLDELGSLQSLPPKDLRWKKILQDREIGVALAWRRLCTRELRGSATPSDRDTAFLCLRNFAVVLTRVNDNDQSTRLFQQASWLAPQDPDLRLNEGRNLFWRNEDPDHVLATSDEPMTVLQGVFDDGLETRDRGFLWSTVAHVLARTADAQDKASCHKARLAQNRFLDLAGTASPENLKEILFLGLEAPPRESTDSCSGSSASPPADEPSARLQALGFGPQRTAKACRERLQRLCKFLLGLEHEDSSGLPGKSTIRELKKAFETAENRDASRKRRILYLEDLCLSLGRAVRSNEERTARDRKEIPTTYFSRNRWASPSGEREIDQKRHEILEKSLTTLKLLPLASSKPQLLTLFEELLPALKVPEQDFVAAPEDLVQSFDDCADDWEWAYLQVLIRLATLLLEEEPGRPEILKQAAGLLEEAIERLEDKELLQARRQGLYGTLAGTYLRLAQLDHQADAEEKQQSLHKALTYAQHAVELEPESIKERCKLLEVLSELGDYEEMKAEADIALDLDSSSETLKVVGKCFWRRIAALRDPRERRTVLAEAVRFFRGALTHVESDPFDSEDPMEQVRAHGWAHFWLGRFLCESGGHDEGAVHLGTAQSLGFKPLESRVELAWAYLLGGNPEADPAFREAIRHADSPSRTVPPQRMGEELPAADLKLDARLGLAFLWADRDPGQAKRELAEARNIAPQPESDHFRAVAHELEGRIALMEGRLKRAVEELEQSLVLLPRSGAFCALASARLQQARYNEKGRAEALRQAWEAYRLAHESDVRVRHRRELANVLRQLRKMQKTATAPA